MSPPALSRELRPTPIRPVAQKLASIAPSRATRPTPSTLVCFAHLRWNFVYQRPQHLLVQLARTWRIVFVEEPVADDANPPSIEHHPVGNGITVLVPRLPGAACRAGDPQGERWLADLVGKAVAALTFHDAAPAIHWYYTPMALGYTQGPAFPASSLVVYDCMDELSQFRFAPAQLLARERQLMTKADLVFTGGHSLFEAKRSSHRRAHCFPSSVDRAHFAVARQAAADPPDMAGLPHPRIGYHGVIDERIDLALLAEVATRRPDWQLVMVGPVVKIDAADLPRAANLHYLGSKTYGELPAYVGRWDVCMMPFALNEATRYISPTKTPEYLAAGAAVVSTPIADVVKSWGGSGLVAIADGAAAFVDAIEQALRVPARGAALCAHADRLLEGMSWEATAGGMQALMVEQLEARRAPPAQVPRYPASTFSAHRAAEEPSWTA